MERLISPVDVAGMLESGRTYKTHEIRDMLNAAPDRGAAFRDDIKILHGYLDKANTDLSLLRGDLVPKSNTVKAVDIPIPIEYFSWCAYVLSFVMQGFLPFIYPHEMKARDSFYWEVKEYPSLEAAKEAFMKSRKEAT